MDGFVSAYSKSTGQKQRIPRHWIGHPVLGLDFELTPSSKADEQPSTADVPKQRKTRAPKDPDDTPSPAETPATGDTKED